MARRVPTVKIVAPDRFGREFIRIDKEDYDPDEHTLWEDREEAQPSDELVEALGTRQANRLARTGLTTIEEALSFHRGEGDLTELDHVGEGTVDDLLDAEG